MRISLFVVCKFEKKPLEELSNTEGAGIDELSLLNLKYKREIFRKAMTGYWIFLKIGSINFETKNNWRWEFVGRIHFVVWEFSSVKVHRFKLTSRRRFRFRNLPPTSFSSCVGLLPWVQPSSVQFSWWIPWDDRDLSWPLAWSHPYQMNRLCASKNIKCTQLTTDNNLVPEFLPYHFSQLLDDRVPSSQE